MARFAPVRNAGPDQRAERIEQHLAAMGDVPANLAQLLDNLGSRIDPTGAGVQGLLDSGVASAPPAPATQTLQGDVIGTVAQTNVVAIENVPIPAPVAGDDQKFIRYKNATPTFEYAFVAMAGDVTGDNTAAKVVKIQNVGVPAPVPGNDLQVLQYQNAGPAFGYVPITTLTLLGGWTVADISTLGVADAEILNGLAGNTALGNVMVGAGFLVGIAIRLSGDVGGVGNNFIATGYKNGVATAVTATVTGTAGTDVQAFATVTPVAFAAGDLVSCYAKIVGAPAAVRASVLLYGRFS